MSRARTGQAISPGRRTAKELKRLEALLQDAERQGDLGTWKRAKALLGYIGGKRVIQLAEDLGVARSTVNQWLRWYEARGADGLRTRKPPGAAPRLSPKQQSELVELIEGGPQAYGYTGGVWTGPRIGDLIWKRFGVRYHNHHVPRLLHQLGFSVQRPRKRLARADIEAQEIWLRKRLPAIKKKRPAAAE